MDQAKISVNKLKTRHNLILGIFILMLSCNFTYTKETADTNMIYGVSTQKNISVVEWNKKTGTLTEIQRIPVGITATAIARNEKHKLIYVASRTTNDDNTPNGLIFNLGKDGKLALKSKFTFAHGYAYLSLDRTGNFLLGASYFSGHTDVYKLDDNGHPHKVETIFENRDKAHAVLTSPDNRYAYIPYVKDNNALFQYSFDDATGKLKPLKPAQAKVDPTAGPRHIAFHPTKQLAYFSNEQQTGVSVYKIEKSGQLQLIQLCPVNNSEPQKGTSASAIAITPSGKYLFTAMRGKTEATNAIIGYKVQNDGKLQSISKTLTDKTPWIIRITPDGNHLLVSASTGGTLTAYKISQSAKLEEQSKLPWGQRFHDMLIVD